MGPKLLIVGSLAATLLALPATVLAGDAGAVNATTIDGANRGAANGVQDKQEGCPHPGQVHLLDFMSFSVGFVGQVGANFLDKPSDQTVSGAEVPYSSEYPGFVGLTTGFGPTLEVRFLGLVGLEFDVLIQTDKGSADLTYTERDANGAVVKKTDYTIELVQSAVHLPLLLKGTLPSQWITPMLFLGPEFVIPSNAKCEGACTINPSETTYSAYKESYTAFTFGLGFEINLPVPVVDVRIPIQLRGNYSPSVSSKRDERGHFTVGKNANNQDIITQADFSTAWKFQAVAHFGVNAHF